MQALESTKTSQVIPADLARLLHLLPFPSHRAVLGDAPNKAELEVLANMLQIYVDKKGASIPVHESLKDSCLEGDVIRRAKFSLVAKGCLSTSGSNHLISDSGLKAVWGESSSRSRLTASARDIVPLRDFSCCCLNAGQAFLLALNHLGGQDKGVCFAMIADALYWRIEDARVIASRLFQESKIGMNKELIQFTREGKKQISSKNSILLSGEGSELRSEFVQQAIKDIVHFLINKLNCNQGVSDPQILKALAICDIGGNHAKALLTLKKGRHLVQVNSEEPAEKGAPKLFKLSDPSYKPCNSEYDIEKLKSALIRRAKTGECIGLRDGRRASLPYSELETIIGSFDGQAVPISKLIDEFINKYEISINYQALIRALRRLEVKKRIESISFSSPESSDRKAYRLLVSSPA